MKTVRNCLSVMLAFVLAFACVCAAAEGDEWVCPDCGAANAMNFCLKCGAKKPEEILCPECGAKFPPDGGIAFCGNCGASLKQTVSSSGKYEGEGFATPEEALSFYMEGFKNLDFSQILGAFAWETQIERMSLQTYFERMTAYSPAVMPRMPSVNGFMSSANVESLRANQVRYLYSAIEYYILGEEAPHGMTIPFDKDDPEAIPSFLAKFDNGRLEKLTEMTNIRFLSPDEVTGNLFSNERNQESFRKQTAYYNADEVVNIIGIADVGKETFACCPTIARYGDRWYLLSVTSMTTMMMGVDFNCQAFVCGEETNKLLGSYLK